jgi:hypothetical protein
MRVRNILTGKIFEAGVLPGAGLAASSYGQPVLCVKREDGHMEPVDAWAFEVVEEEDKRPYPFNRRPKPEPEDPFDPRD